MRLLAMGLLLSCVCACRHGESVPDDPDANKLPRIELPAVGPEDYDPSQLANRVVLVHFTASYCFPCLTEIPSLQTLQKKYGERGFQVIAIGMDLEGKKVLEPFAYHYKMPFPVLVADDDYRNGRSRFGRIPVLPATFLFARDGAVIAAWGGPANLPDVEKAVEAALR